MKATVISPASNCYLRLLNRQHPLSPNHQILRFNNRNPSYKPRPFPSLAIKSSQSPYISTTGEQEPRPPPLVVVASANADIYVEIDTLPKVGETISAKRGQTIAGGKVGNQAACGGKLSYPSYFVGQIGEDAHGRLITDALSGGGVCLDYVRRVENVPTGHAVVMLQSDGQNFIIIIGGANMCCWPEKLSDEEFRE